MPCTTPLGDGYIWYITHSGTWENDVFTVVLSNGGDIKHFTSDQVRMWHNETFGIKKNEFKF
jgi:hypothetical protein